MEYSYVENGLVWFNEDSIVEQFVDVKWNGFTKAHYVDLGYVCDNWYQPFTVDVRHLSNRSGVKVVSICPMCDHKRGLKFANIMIYEHTKCFGCAKITDLTDLAFTRLSVKRISWSK